jgi:parallel beta-helix repeat protein
MMRGILVALLALLPFTGALGDIIHVPGDYPTIQEGVDAAESGDIVLVAPGTYVENILIPKTNLSLMSSHGPQKTIIDGNRISSVIESAWNSSIELIEGFTIRNGDGYMASGIELWSSSPLIRNNIIQDNINSVYGGVGCEASDADVIDNIIIDNQGSWSAGIGGFGSYSEIKGNVIAGNDGIGIYGEESHQIIEDNIISDNTYQAISLDWGFDPKIRNNLIQGNGGGVVFFNFMDDVEITGNVFAENTRSRGGAIDGIYSAQVTNNLFYNNSAVWRGGAVFCSHYGDVFFSNNTFVKNSAGSKGGAIYFDDSPDTTVLNCIFWNNTAPEGVSMFFYGGQGSVTFSDVQGGWPGTGNIDEDPLFADPLSHDFHLLQDPVQPGVFNPCVDAGDPVSPMIEGTTRTDGIQDQGIVDMGYHYDLAEFLKVPELFPTIQQAIDMAEDGQTVLVAAGTYKENIDFLGKAITVTSRAGATETVIDGGRAGSVVAFQNGEDDSSILNGFLITNGNTNRGGGIWCYQSSPLIMNNVLFNNQANTGGAMECVINASPTVLNNTIVANSAVKGGGIYIDQSSPHIANTIFWNNIAATGPEIHVESGSPTVIFCDVQGGWPGMGNIDEDPLFAAPASGDVHLTAASPCIDSGDPEQPKLPAKDFEGDPRCFPKNGKGMPLKGAAAQVIADMGADEYCLMKQEPLNRARD